MKQNHLYIVNKENAPVGPISRLGLWYRFPKVNQTRLYLQIGMKIALLATVIYCTKKMGM